MYERNVIVIEKYIDNLLGLNKKANIKLNFENYKNLIEEFSKFQDVSNEEKKIIEEFDICIKEIETIQKKQEKVIQSNQKMEDTRNSLFYELPEDSKGLEAKFVKIENTITSNMEELTELRNNFIEHVTIFTEKQKERNRCEKTKRLAESNHIVFLKKVVEDFSQIEIKDLKDLKEFLYAEKSETKQEIMNLIEKNGKNEKVKFDEEVVRKVIDIRIDILEKEIESYLIAYDKMKRLLSEIDNENLKMDKYQKILRDMLVKYKFLGVEKEYLASFLDYERLSSMSGSNIHNNLMREACENFEKDIIQIDNLYQLILKEITNKSTKKAYNELYNKTYLQDIEENEKHFEKEANNIRTNVATVINTSYWRIEGIKNIYTTFIDEISEKFEKDLSEYKNNPIEEEQEEEEFIFEDEDKVDSKEEIEEFVFEEDDDKYDEDEEEEYEEDEDEEYEEEEYEEDEDEEEYDDEYLENEDEDEYEDDYEEYEEEYEEDYDDEAENEHEEDINEIDFDRIFEKSDKSYDAEENSELEQLFEENKPDNKVLDKKDNSLFKNIFGKGKREEPRNKRK